MLKKLLEKYNTKES